FNRGWSEFLTVYGRELNLDSNGNQRINLNDSSADPKTVSDNLTAGLGQEMSDFLMAAKLWGTASTAPTTTSTVQVSGVMTSQSSALTSTGTRTTTVTVKLSNGTNDRDSGGNNSQPKTVTGGAAELRTAVQAALDAGTQASKKVTSIMSLYNTKVTLPKPANA